MPLLLLNLGMLIFGTVSLVMLFVVLSQLSAMWRVKRFRENFPNSYGVSMSHGMYVSKDLTAIKADEKISPDFLNRTV